jgi:ABC-type polysaccharide transport system permease subunit
LVETQIKILMKFVRAICFLIRTELQKKCNRMYNQVLSESSSTSCFQFMIVDGLWIHFFVVDHGMANIVFMRYSWSYSELREDTRFFSRPILFLGGHRNIRLPRNLENLAHFLDEIIQTNFEFKFFLG